MKIKDIITQSKLNWMKVMDSNPAFKRSGQKEFTWENHERLRKKAEDYDNQNVILGDKK